MESILSPKNWIVENLRHSLEMDGFCVRTKGSICFRLSSRGGEGCMEKRMEFEISYTRSVFLFLQIQKSGRNFILVVARSLIRKVFSTGACVFGPRFDRADRACIPIFFFFFLSGACVSVNLLELNKHENSCFRSNFRPCFRILSLD